MTDTAPTPKAVAAALEGVTLGPWNLCAHLAHENENGCKCGYRGVIYAGETDYAVCQPGHDATPGEEDLDPPRLPRHEEIANARFIAWARNNVEAIAADRDAQRARADEWQAECLAQNAALFAANDRIAKLAEALAKAANRLDWASGLIATEKGRDQATVWAEEARAAIAEVQG